MASLEVEKDFDVNDCFIVGWAGSCTGFAGIRQKGPCSESHAGCRVAGSPRRDHGDNF